MNEHPVKIRRALISVSDKTGVTALASGLQTAGIEILSTGGTAFHLREAGIPVLDVSNLTGFPEIMEGRVKTLHPAIHGGILGLRDKHADTAREHGIEWIDLVIVNLYPFARTIRSPDVTLDLALLNIDIGGPSMIRSAAKNTGWVTVVVDPADYPALLTELSGTGHISFATRKHMAAKAFQHTANYDAVIASWLSDSAKTVTLKKLSELRYGENPHQPASLWELTDRAGGILNADVLQGKPLSYNNLVDADAAFACVRDFAEPACVIVKHATPCGLAVDTDPGKIFAAALSCDPLSAFGGVVAFNRPCTREMAQAVTERFMEVLLAPAICEDALPVLARKPDLRVLAVDFETPRETHEMKYIQGGLLIQARDTFVPTADILQSVTREVPEADIVAELLHAARMVKHIKSNAIVIVRDGMAVGIGGGQVSRVDAVQLALQKAGKRSEGAVLASDAFFPFRDSIDCLAEHGIRAVIQPGGSVRDREVIAACDTHGIAMVFTGKRCFRH